MFLFWIKIQNKLWQTRKNFLTAKSAIKTKRTEDRSGGAEQMVNFNI
jgi:hypothetical protein